MSNSYFQFKQFRIEQKRCAMKVCTDSCIQGALAAKELVSKETETILDIGTGTGLLSLMLAQNHTFQKQDAVEVNKDAFEQARENFSSNHLGKNIRLTLGDIRSFHPRYKYDFIICNPPFYENYLKSPSVSKNQAMHASHLSYSELLKIIQLFLNPSGFCSLMLPFNLEMEIVNKAKKTGLYPYKITRIRNREGKPPFRTVLFMKQRETQLSLEELIIRNSDHSYSERFIGLLTPYYLNL